MQGLVNFIEGKHVVDQRDGERGKVIGYVDGAFPSPDKDGDDHDGIAVEWVRDKRIDVFDATSFFESEVCLFTDEADAVAYSVNVEAEVDKEEVKGPRDGCH